MESTRAIRVFYSYADRDEFLRNELEKHLIILHRQGRITSWHHRKITAGQELNCEVDTHMKNAQLILLLVSPDFLASEYCYELEMKQALERHESEEALVIPILLRPVDWQGASFSHLQALPINGKPVTSWSGRNGRDKAFLEVALGIRTAIVSIEAKLEIARERQLTSTASRDIDTTDSAELQRQALAFYNMQNAGLLYESGRYQEAITIYEEALRLDPNDVASWSGRGDALYRLERYQEAIISYERALRLDPNDVVSWSGRGDALYRLKHYQEAIISYEGALRLDPKNACVAIDMKRETTLRANYFEKFSDLLLQGLLSDVKPEYKEMQNLARLWTLTILYQIRKDYKASVLQFLYKSSLLTKGKCVIDLCRADLSEANLDYADLQGADLRGATLREVVLRRANLNYVNLQESDLHSADLSEANLHYANLSAANLIFADLRGANLRGAKLDKTVLKYTKYNTKEILVKDSQGNILAKVSATIWPEGFNPEAAETREENTLYHVNLQGTDLQGADLRFDNLQGVNLSNVNLSGADLHHADLRGANLSGADLSAANLSNAKLQKANLQEANLKGVTGVAEREEYILDHVDLREANLRGADLQGANLRGADLQGADLQRADLRFVNLQRANLSNAKLQKADLREANLKGATGVSVKELEKEVLLLSHSIMPNGERHS